MEIPEQAQSISHQFHRGIAVYYYLIILYLRRHPGWVNRLLPMARSHDEGFENGHCLQINEIIAYF